MTRQQKIPIASLSIARVLLPLSVPLLLAISSTAAMERVQFRRNNTEIQAYGELIVEAANGDLMLRSQDGRLWIIQGSEVVSRESDKEAFRPLTKKEAQAALLAELPKQYSIIATEHYSVAYNTSRPYARWVSQLLERLYKGFHNFARTKGFELTVPDTPLVVLVFDSEAAYKAYATKELGTAPDGMLAYYNVETNRVAMYDLTGVEALASRFPGERNERKIGQILQDPAAAPMVATIVHEATHQISFNCGMQNRFGDWPFWLSEGLAMYFETPDLRKSSGWGGVGQVNPIRLAQLAVAMPKRPKNSLVTLIGSDVRLRDRSQMIDAYAESWALVYFLLQKYPKEFVAYFSELQTHKVLQESTEEERLKLFSKHFGDDLNKFDQEFVKFVSELKLED